MRVARLDGRDENNPRLSGYKRSAMRRERRRDTHECGQKCGRHIVENCEHSDAASVYKPRLDDAVQTVLIFWTIKKAFCLRQIVFVKVVCCHSGDLRPGRICASAEMTELII